MADAGQESSEGISVSKPVARVMMLVNAAVWGSGYTMLKHVQENMPTQWMMFFRMASAVLLMAIVFFPRLRRIRLRRYIVPGLILALTYWLGFIFQLKGLETTSPGRNSFFTDTYCVMVPFVVWAFTRKRPSWQHLVAAFVCAFGIGLVSLSGGGGAELMHMSFGDAMTISRRVFLRVESGLVGFIGKDFDAIALMLAEFVWCALLFGAGAVLTEGGPSMAWARWDIVLCIAYLVIGSTVIAQSVSNHRHTESAHFRGVRDLKHGMHLRHAGIRDFHRRNADRAVVMRFRADFRCDSAVRNPTALRKTTAWHNGRRLEEQRRDSRREAHEQHGREEARQERFLSLLRDGAEIHIDAERRHGHAEHNVCEIDQIRCDGTDERHERADDGSADEAEHEPWERHFAFAVRWHFGMVFYPTKRR